MNSFGYASTVVRLSLLFFLLLCCGEPVTSKFSGHPVILIPGDGGTQIFAKLNKPDVKHYFCEKITSDYFSLWLNLELLVPYVLDCFVDNMKLRYDPTTRKTYNQPGVSTQILNFGNTSSVEYLDPTHVYPTLYFGNIVDNLITAGYQRGISIRAAPYDFRKAANELNAFFTNLKSLIETTYVMNENRSIVIVAHSMGNPNFLYFLQKIVSEKWKKTYIKSWVAVSSPLGGAAKSVRVEVSGDNLGIIVVNTETIRPLQRSLVSSAWMMPRPEVWNHSTPIVMTAKRNYTVLDYKDLFYDMNFIDGYNMWKDTKDLVDINKAPGVEVHCINGINVKTQETYTYAKSYFPNGSPTVHYGNGDGTVNIQSLRVCPEWASKQQEKVFHSEMTGAEHVKILWLNKLAEYILKIAYPEHEISGQIAKDGPPPPDVLVVHESYVSGGGGRSQYKSNPHHYKRPEYHIINEPDQNNNHHL